MTTEPSPTPADGVDQPASKRPLPAGFITRAAAVAAGQTSWRFRQQHRRLFHGVHAANDDPVEEHRLWQAALAIAPPGSYLSHHSAARLFGGVVPDDPDAHVTCPGARTKAKGIAAHRAKQAQQVTTRRGLRTTTALQTFLDLAQALPLVELVVLGDSLVKKDRFSMEELVAFTAKAAGPHHRKAKLGAALVRAGVDSPMETRLRLLIVLAGLPEPTVNHQVLDGDGNVVRRFDLAYVGARLAIEYDGRQHAESTEQWHGDIVRDEELDDWQVRRLVIVAKDIYSTPGNTLRRIAKVMRACGMTVPPMSNEWRRHFPSRPGDVAEPA